MRTFYLIVLVAPLCMGNPDCSFQVDDMQGVCEFRSCGREYNKRYGQYRWADCCRTCICKIGADGVGYSPDYWCSASFPCRENFTSSINYYGVDQCHISSNCTPTCQCRAGFKDYIDPVTAKTIKCGWCDACTCPVARDTAALVSPQSKCKSLCPGPVPAIAWNNTEFCHVSRAMVDGNIDECRLTCKCRSGFVDGDGTRCGVCATCTCPVDRYTEAATTPASNCRDPCPRTFNNIY